MIRMTKGQWDLFRIKIGRKPKSAGEPISAEVKPKAASPRRNKNELPENIVKNQVIDFLAMRGWTVTRQHVGTYVPYRVLMSLCGSIQASGGAGIHAAIEAARRNIIRIGSEGESDWRAERRHSGSLFYVMYIEFKRPGATPEPHQLNWILEKQLLGTPADWFDCFHSGEDGRKPFIDWYRRNFEPDYPKSLTEISAGKVSDPRQQYP